MNVPAGISLSDMSIELVMDSTGLFALESVASVVGALVLFDASKVLSVLFVLPLRPRRKNRLPVINRMAIPTALEAITNFFLLPELLRVFECC